MCDHDAPAERLHRSVSMDEIGPPDGGASGATAGSAPQDTAPDPGASIPTAPEPMVASAAEPIAVVAPEPMVASAAEPIAVVAPEPIVASSTDANAPEDVAPEPESAEAVESLDVVEPVDAEPVEATVTAVGDTSSASAPASRAGRVLGYLVAAVAGGAIVLAALAVTGRIGAGVEPAASPSPSPSAAADAASSGAAPVLGDPAAPVLVEIWADYQCPYCGIMNHAMEGALLRDYVDTGRIRLAFRDFAFLGQESIEAAAAARCAGQQDGYWRYHDLLFASQQGENQGAFAAKNLVSIAGFAGLDREKFATCMNDSAVRTAVTAETEAGRALGVASTPSVNVVGPKGTTLLKGVPGFDGIDAAIEEVTTGVKPSPSPSPVASPSAGASTAPAVSPSPAASGASPTP
jgi:protein-disulfide isomerase